MHRLRHTTPTRSPARTWGVGLLMGAVVLASCARNTGYQPIAPDDRPLVADVDGDWDDLGVAASVGASNAQAAITSTVVTDDRAVFELVTVTGEPGVLIVTRQGDHVVASVHIGLFGDAGRQRDFMRAFARRLADLAGVPYAPL